MRSDREIERDVREELNWDPDPSTPMISPSQ
jgi:hypothetical protein